MNRLRIENSAKAIIRNADDEVLLIRCRDSTDMGLGTWYALPGGRQRPGETLAEALGRECREEIGTGVQVGQLLFVREYIHARHEPAGTGRNQHKIEFMFACEPTGKPDTTRTADADQTAAEWVPLGKLGDLNIFPRRLREPPALPDATDMPVYWGDEY